MVTIKVLRSTKSKCTINFSIDYSVNIDRLNILHPFPNKRSEMFRPSLDRILNYIDFLNHTEGIKIIQISLGGQAGGKIR